MVCLYTVLSYTTLRDTTSGDVLKSAGSSEMVRSVGVVACGGLNFESDALVRLLGRVPNQGRLANSADAAILSEREIAVLSLIVRGYKNREIGQNLNVSNSTVKSDLVNIKSKLMLDSRAELAAFAGQRFVLKVQEDRIL